MSSGAAAAVPYYNRGGIETEDYLRAKLGDDGYEAHLIGRIHKKLHKAHLGAPQDKGRLYQEAGFYMGRLLDLRSAQGPGAPPRRSAAQRDGDTADDAIRENFSRLSVTRASAPDPQPARADSRAIEPPAPAAAAAWPGLGYGQAPQAGPVEGALVQPARV